MLSNQSNLRMTRQRQVILDALRQVDTHPSADEIYAMVRKRLPRISLGTVYRNLEILSESGDIQKLELGSNLKRFDGKAHRHYHMRCIRCDRVLDAPIHFTLDIEDRVQAATDFQILGHQLEFTGLCPACQ